MAQYANIIAYAKTTAWSYQAVVFKREKKEKEKEKEVENFVFICFLQDYNTSSQRENVGQIKNDF